MRDMPIAAARTAPANVMVTRSALPLTNNTIVDDKATQQATPCVA